MTHISEKCVYFCGPYKGFCGKAEYDPEAELFHGEIIGTRDVVTFQGTTPAELRRSFQESVDDYLAFCQQRGEQPEKPLSGNFMTRLDPDMHRQISQRAELAGKSLNQFVRDCLSAAAADPLLPGAKLGAGLPARQKARSPTKPTASGGKSKRGRAKKSA
jgi:predicted HicB family RNase H-like nuclease